MAEDDAVDGEAVDDIDGRDDAPSSLVRDIRGTLPAELAHPDEPAIADDGVSASQPLTEPSDD